MGIELNKQVELETQFREMFMLIKKFKGLANDELDKKKDKILQYIHKFELKSEVLRHFIAIDGSQTWLWSPLGMNIWTMLNRIGLVHYSIQDNQYHLIHKELVDNVELISTLEEVVAHQSIVHQKLYEYVITDEKNRGREHDVIAGRLMRFLEHEVALNYAKHHENVVIALDGALLAFFSKEFLASANTTSIIELIEVCEANNNILIGISKDSKTHYLSDYLTDEFLLFYTTLGSSARFYLKMEKSIQNALGDIYFVKLHPLAQKWFRIDLGTMKDAPEEAFQIVAQYARDQMALGYPFPLTEAHKLAVTVRQYRNLYEQLLFDIGPLYGFDPTEILRGFTNMEGHRRNIFHEHLDFISKLKK